MARVPSPPPLKDDPRFDTWMREMWPFLKALVEGDAVPAASNISDAEAAALVGGGASTLHYHASDRARANHTGSQPAATISDLESTVRSWLGSSDHAALNSLAWGSSGHTGTAYTLTAFGASGVASALAVGATTEILVGGGASALPVWTTATGSGAPVRQTAAAVGGVWTAAAAWTLPAHIWGGTITANGQTITGAITVSASANSSTLLGTFINPNTGASSQGYIVVGQGARGSTFGADYTGDYGFWGLVGQVPTFFVKGTSAGVGTSAPIGKFHVVNATNIGLSVAGVVAGYSGSVSLNAINDAGSANIPMEIRATKFAFTGPTAATQIDEDGDLSVGGALAVTGTVLGSSSIKSNSPTAGIGYATGAGGTVVQSGSKAGGVTLDAASGEITMNGAALAADTSVTFALTNSCVADGDVLLCVHYSTGTVGAYTFQGRGTAAGVATITVRNVSPGSLSEAIVIRFAVIKGVTS